jgi:hypothetical protein
MSRATPGFSFFKFARVLLPIALAISAGSALVAYQAVSTGSTSARIAGEAKMQMLRDEHALVADYLKMDTEAKRRAYATADQEAAALKVAALEQSRLRVAQAESLATTERKSPTAKTAIRIEPVALTVAALAGEPLPLAQLAQVAQVAQVANANAAAPRVEEGPVRSRFREFVSDVRRVPGWFASAADWMAESAPVPRLPHLPDLPGRQFRAEL